MVIGQRGGRSAAEEPDIPVPGPEEMLGKRASVKGWYSGIARDSEDTLDFSQRNNVASMNEIYPLEKAQEAYDRMLSGKARFRVVLKMEGQVLAASAAASNAGFSGQTRLNGSRFVEACSQPRRV